jgi:hypothetical protein
MDRGAGADLGLILLIWAQDREDTEIMASECSATGRNKQAMQEAFNKAPLIVHLVPSGMALRCGGCGRGRGVVVGVLVLDEENARSFGGGCLISGFRRTCDKKGSPKISK